MALIALKCPSCNGDIQLNDGTEFGFCMYCGARIIVSELINGKSQEVAALLKVAETCAPDQTRKAFEYACRATDVDPASADAWIARARYAPDSREKEFAIENASKLAGDTVKGRQIDSLRESAHVTLRWSSMAFNWNCTCSVDGTEFQLDGAMKTSRSLAPGKHTFVFKAPSKNLSLAKEVDIREDCTISLDIRKSFFGSSLLLDVSD